VALEHLSQSVVAAGLHVCQQLTHAGQLGRVDRVPALLDQALLLLLLPLQLHTVALHEGMSGLCCGRCRVCCGEHGALLTIRR
jgi:hypothetical protein